MKSIALTCTAQSSLDVSNFSARVRRACVTLGLGLHQTEELACVVDALGTNAVVHGYGGTITVVLERCAWRVSTLDVGPGFTCRELERAEGWLALAA